MEAGTGGVTGGGTAGATGPGSGVTGATGPSSPSTPTTPFSGSTGAGGPSGPIGPTGPGSPTTPAPPGGGTGATGSTPPGGTPPGGVTPTPNNYIPATPAGYQVGPTGALTGGKSWAESAQGSNLNATFETFRDLFQTKLPANQVELSLLATRALEG